MPIIAEFYLAAISERRDNSVGGGISNTDYKIKKSNPGILTVYILLPKFQPLSIDRVRKKVFWELHHWS